MLLRLLLLPALALSLRLNGNNPTEAFKNVLLVVHCRLPKEMESVCQERFRLFRPLKVFFAEVLFWTQKDCRLGPFSPHNCLAELARSEKAAARDGVFYMHFDALVKPLVLQKVFDPNAIGIFSEQEACDFERGCGWLLWQYQKSKVERAMAASNFTGSFWLGCDDVFYLPKALFQGYAELAGHWEGVHHEIAGPTMWRILSKRANVAVVSLGCKGSCCDGVSGEEALSPDLACGHPFRLEEWSNREDFARAMLMS